MKQIFQFLVLVFHAAAAWAGIASLQYFDVVEWIDQAPFLAQHLALSFFAIGIILLPYYKYFNYFSPIVSAVIGVLVIALLDTLGLCYTAGL